MSNKHEECDVCGELTGRAGEGDDSLYSPQSFGWTQNGTHGPLCQDCYDIFSCMERAQDDLDIIWLLENAVEHRLADTYGRELKDEQELARKMVRVAERALNNEHK